ncbi:CTB family bacteriocin [Sphaerospermopsis aphanizomenoides BCCUSP55]|uniref:CTB family bacteriocin n=1 Tax=Sphaerospermopsis aphanizomenoides TaxID=459663 RepID=UPI001905DD1D|nr:CTB family bacteriocin [Sphaerospermopsis aphanizomenoides]MBK1988095.1 CTB family bacteriocin [Sphaerospermopsis aphanizomenoides BCCUSP55]
MLNQINNSDLFVALSDEQQELVTGGADFELAGSNYANKLSALRGAATSGPQGSTAVSVGASNAINTAAQDFLGLGGLIPPNVTPLGNAPSFNGTNGLPSGGGADQTGIPTVPGVTGEQPGATGEQPGVLQQPETLLQGASGLGAAPGQGAAPGR